MANKIDVPLWQNRVSRAIDLQNKQKNERLDINRLYQGKFLSGNRFDANRKSELNFLFEYVRLVKGVTYAKNPHIFCRAYHNNYVSFAETMEKVLNYYMTELQTKYKLKSSLNDGIMQPPGFIAIGYRGDIEMTGRKRAEEDFPELRTTAEKEPEQAGLFDETIKNNDVFLRFVSSWYMVWPDGYHDIRSAPYMIEIEPITLLDLYANPMYKDSKYKIGGALPQHTAQARITPFTMKANIPVPLTNQNRYGRDEETIIKRLYHIWDKRSRKRFTLAEGFTDDTLFERDWDDLIEGFLHYPLIFNDVPQTDTDANSYPMSDVIPMLPQLRDLSIINDAILRHGKRAGTIVFARKGGLTTTEVTNIQNAGDMDLVFLESISEEHIRTYTTAALPADWYKIRQLIIEDLMRISGFQQLLAQVKGIETATESENIARGELSLVSEKVDTVEDYIKDIFRGLAGIIWQRVPRRRIQEIVGEQITEEMWPSLPEDKDEARRIIQKELLYKIDAGSTKPPKNEAVERKQWIDAAAMLKQTFPDSINNSELAMQIAKKTGFKDLENMIKTNDDQEIAVAQEENKLLMQGVKQLVSPNEKHILHLQVHSQVYQTPGLTPTPQMDEHITKHDQFRQMQNPLANAQRGDIKAPASTTMPEQRRGGVPDAGDIVGGATNVNRGIGANIKGGL